MKKGIIFSFLLVLIFTNCTNDEKPQPVNPDLTIQNFIWKGLNLYYLWQEDVPDLLDTRFNEDQTALENYLVDFSNPADLFENLLYQRNITDKFSWIVDDYIALENAFQGVTLSNGVEFGLVRQTSNPSNLFGYVRYILPNSDASSKNIQRGDLFNAVNGTPLTVNNYISLLSNVSYTLNLADYNAGNPISNGQTVSLTRSEYQENPIYTVNTFTVSGQKIGYIMYNAFNSSYNNELNSAFLTLKSQNIDALILDLRYNGGGSVKTATYLASMITGQFNGQLFSKNVWNSKIQPILESDYPESINNDFTNTINGAAIHSLNLSSLYVITTKSSASASELVINGLKPYIDVKQVGTTTRGKYVGSITLYDSPDFGRAAANPTHTWAMQPITFEAKNKLNANAPAGFVPDILFGEDFNNLGVLGQLDEPLLARTITYIITGARFSSETNQTIDFQEISSSKMMLPTKDNMYLD